MMWSSNCSLLQIAEATVAFFCDSVRSPWGSKLMNCPVRFVNCSSDGRAPSIHGEFCALNEACAVCRQEDNCFRNFVGCCRTTRGRLGGELFKTLSHRIRAPRARGPGTHLVNPHALRSVFGSPGFRQQIDGGLACTVEAHPGRSVVSNHRRKIHDCPFASLGHQWSKRRDEKIWSLHVC